MKAKSYRLNLVMLALPVKHMYMSWAAKCLARCSVKWATVTQVVFNLIWNLFCLSISHSVQQTDKKSEGIWWIMATTEQWARLGLNHDKIKPRDCSIICCLTRVYSDSFDILHGGGTKSGYITNLEWPWCLNKYCVSVERYMGAKE